MFSLPLSPLASLVFASSPIFVFVCFVFLFSNSTQPYISLSLSKQNDPFLILNCIPSQTRRAILPIYACYFALRLLFSHNLDGHLHIQRSRFSFRVEPREFSAFVSFFLFVFFCLFSLQLFFSFCICFDFCGILFLFRFFFILSLISNEEEIAVGSFQTNDLVWGCKPECLPYAGYFIIIIIIKMKGECFGIGGFGNIFFSLVHFCLCFFFFFHLSLLSL